MLSSSASPRDASVTAKLFDGESIYALYEHRPSRISKPSGVRRWAMGEAVVGGSQATGRSPRAHVASTTDIDPIPLSPASPPHSFCTRPMSAYPTSIQLQAAVIASPDSDEDEDEDESDESDEFLSFSSENDEPSWMLAVYDSDEHTGVKVGKFQTAQ